MTQKLVLLAGLSVILITTFIAVCDANDPCLKQGIAFVANQPLGAVGFGHVAVGFLRCDGNFFFASLGPGNYAFPATVKADIETESFADWVHAESWLWNANYHKIKVIQIDNPDPNAAMDEINKPENYNLLASTAWDQETEDNCLTFTIKVLTAYGVNGLSTSPPTEAPNMYFEAYIPGKEYSWSNDLNRYSDSEGNTLRSDQAIQNAAVAGATNMGTQPNPESSSTTIGSTTSPYSIDFDLKNMLGFNDNEISANDIEDFIKEKYPNSPMLSESGIGSCFISIGKNNFVNPAFLVATAYLESGFGTAGWAASHPECHNTFGYGIPSGTTLPDDYNCMDSWCAVIQRVASSIAHGDNYYKQGLHTVSQVRSKYATNPNADSIASLMNELYVFSMNRNHEG